MGSNLLFVKKPKAGCHKTHTHTATLSSEELLGCSLRKSHLRSRGKVDAHSAEDSLLCCAVSARLPLVLALWRLQQIVQAHGQFKAMAVRLDFIPIGTGPANGNQDASQFG